MTVKIDGARLKIRDVVRASRPNAKGRFEKAVLDPQARERIAATRAYIDRTWMHDDAPLMYAFNTGVGLFKDQRVLISDMAAYQHKTVYAHATGVGEPFAEDVTRAMMLLRANAFASNYSGPRVELVERLIAFLNAGLHPVIPQKGSVGASGDLAPLAHMAGAVCGFAGGRDGLPGPAHARPRGHREGRLRARFRPRRQGRLGAHQRLDRVARARRAGDERCAAPPEARRHRHVPVARGDARRARGLRSARAAGASASGPGCASRATCCAFWKDRSAARRPRATSSFPTRPRQPGTPATARACRTSTRCAARRRCTARPWRRSNMWSASSARRSIRPPTTR